MEKLKDRFYFGWEGAIVHLSDVILPIINDKNLNYENKCRAINKLFKDSFQDMKKITKHEEELKEDVRKRNKVLQ